MFQFTEIHHVSLVVQDVAVAKHFYGDFLGLSLVDSRPDLGYLGAWFTIGHQQIHLLKVENVDPVQGRPQHVGRDRHLAFTVLHLNDLCEKLEQAKIIYTKSKSGRAAIFFRDPDGNGIEVIEG